MKWLRGFFGGASNREATEQLAVLSEKYIDDDIEEIRSLISAGADINVRNKYDVTPLYIASQEGHTEIVRLLQEARNRT